ncbi:GNAT family N-acetyltransferase, partial [Tsukamurella soli]|uniref:GNAT family N-acetyltransferase n=1 Tax=Tsukamurella soli TaxID=644556 RepID=UPI0031E9793C
MTALRDDRLQIRIDAASKHRLESAAAHQHLSLSAFLLQAAGRAADEILADRDFVPLDTALHDRFGFRSGSAVLDEWLRRYAGQNRRRDTSATWVIADADHRVVCYATLSMTAIDRSAGPPGLVARAPDPVPALLIGRLATDARAAGRGVGTTMLRHILATAVELNLTVACRTVVVTAIDAQARSWWQRFGSPPWLQTSPRGWTCTCSPRTSPRRSMPAGWAADRGRVGSAAREAPHPHRQRRD